jgi:hypothetical protein
MKAAHKWPAPPDDVHTVVFYYDTDEAARSAPRWKTHAQVESERQHWLDMAHPLPKWKGAK